MNSPVENQPTNTSASENENPVLGKIVRMANSGADAVTSAFKNTAEDVKNHGAFGTMKLVASDVKELLLEGVQSVSTLAAPLNPWNSTSAAETGDGTESSQEPSKLSQSATAVLGDVQKSITNIGGWLSNTLGMTNVSSPAPPATSIVVEAE